MHFHKPIHIVVLAILLALSIPHSLRADDAGTTSPSNDAFFFHDGDTPVVFLGDSITEQKQYTTLIETYILTRFPAWKITFRNAGWSGDRASLTSRGDTFDKALQRDVISFQPKAVTIDYGMNDARAGDTGYAAYLQNQTKLVESLKKAGARVALITSTPEEKYEPDAPGGSSYNVMLKKYAAGLKEVAAKADVPFVDQFTPFVQFIEDGRKAGVLSLQAPANEDAKPYTRLIPGGIHPNSGGHFIMATVILQGLHAPALVSSASLDAEARSTVATQACAVEWQDAPSGVVQFKRTDDVLPWPTREEADFVLKIPGFDPGTTLNNYELKVANLKADSYKLSIDDHAIGTYSQANLASGINLGFMREGPIADQEQKLFRAVSEKNQLYYHRWREVQLNPSDPTKPPLMDDEARTAELAKLDQQILDKEQAIEPLRKPVPHVFRLEPVSK